MPTTQAGSFISENSVEDEVVLIISEGIDALESSVDDMVTLLGSFIGVDSNILMRM